MAAGLAGAVVLWMLTGLVGGSGAPAQSDRQAEGNGAAGASAIRPSAEDRPPGVGVTVRRSRAEPIVRDVVVSGRTEPSRTLEIKAETEGRVVALGAGRGAAVAEGEPIARLDERDRPVALAEAEALMEYRRLQYEAAMQLEGRGLAARAQIAEARSQLEAAEVQLERIRLELERTTIVAPFDGMLEDRSVEIGDYVGVGDTVARFVDNDPLIAVGEISEREIGEIEVGTPGRAQLVDGRIIEGSVRYISPVADSSTRTFRIELSIPNPDNRLPAGMTAELRLPASETEAHFLSPALLTLNDEGDVGVKLVDERDVVRFHEVNVVRSASDGVWVTGLPLETRVITIGQGFVSAGQRVEPVLETQQ